MNSQAFEAKLASHGIVLSPKQLAQFSRYYQLLVEWNQKINLTAITALEEVYLKHFFDSLMPLWMMPQASYAVRVCDVGAGAGFPSIPLKIIHPEMNLTIIDSLQKRINFLNTLINELELTNVTCLHGRAEDIGQNVQYRGQFDLVTARAVAPLNVLAEYCLPLVSIQGHFLALKAQKSETEVQQAQKAITLLGAKLVDESETVLPDEGSKRSYILIKKTKETPNKYPRKAGKPAKNPIQ